MVLSATERSYLNESLKQTPPIRPDGRQPSQFSPMESQLDLVETSNGSAQITLADGSQCLVSIKSKVIETSKNPDLIEVSVDIAGERDDDSLVLTIKSSLLDLYQQNIDPKSLKLTERFSFKLYIDVLVIASFSYPLTLISFTSFLALNHTYLPKLISSVDDKEIEEQPQFHDYELKKLEIQVPIIFTLALIEENVLIDPTSEEIAVADNSLIISWFQDKPITPMTIIRLNDETKLKSIRTELILKSVELVKEVGSDVVKSLNSI